MGRLNSIQILRFLAALLVVVTHAAKPFAIGSAGVDIFFVISGFIIARAATGRAAVPFMIDRVRRIFPIYYICTVPYVLLYWRGAGFGRIMTTLTLWPIYDDYYRPFLSAGWTLSYEMLFYTAVAITLAIPRSRRWLLLAFAAALTANILTHWPIFQFIGSPLVFEFLAGTALANIDRLRVGPAIAAICAGLAILLVSAPFAGWLTSLTVTAEVVRSVVWGAAAAALVAGALGLEAYAGGRACRLLAYLGEASYSIYLTHGIVLVFASAVLSSWAAVAFVVVVGLGVHRYIEHPLLVWLKGRRGRPWGTPALAVAE